jgi:hypothetical protein
MNKIIQFALVFVFMLSFTHTFAQSKFFSKTAVIAFDAEGAMDDVEEIKAKSSTGNCVVIPETGAMEWGVLMKSFQFKNALMQEHFNENYMQSSQYPKAVFKGKIENPASVKWDTDGTYPVNVSGKMTCHGVTKDLATKGAILIKNGVPTAQADFLLTLADYNIEIPSMVGQKIANDVKIKVNTPLTKLAK